MRIKRLIILLAALTALLIAVPAVAWAPRGAPVTTGLELADPPWCYPGSCNLLADDYPNVDAHVTYSIYENSFNGTFNATGMLPNTLYQLKLEGRPTCKYGAEGDDADNMALGQIGRWWDDTAGTNLSDAEVQGAIDAGHCVLGYVIFDCGTSDGSGNLVEDFELDYSYHTCGVTERGEVMLPNGDYDVNFVITENHQWWRTVLTSDVHFTIDHWLDRVDVGSGDGYMCGQPGYLATWSCGVCPTDTGGSFGGIATDPESADGECRTVWAQDFKPNKPYAIIKLWTGYYVPEKLFIRALDGLADDSFEVYVEHDGNWVLVHTYADQYDTETWLIHEIPLPEDLAPSWLVEFKIVATGPQWEHFDTYGQLAVDWIGVWK